MNNEEFAKLWAENTPELSNSQKAEVISNARKSDDLEIATRIKNLAYYTLNFNQYKE